MNKNNDNKEEIFFIVMNIISILLFSPLIFMGKMNITSQYCLAINGFLIGYFLCKIKK